MPNWQFWPLLLEKFSKKNLNWRRSFFVAIYKILEWKKVRVLAWSIWRGMPYMYMYIHIFFNITEISGDFVKAFRWLVFSRLFEKRHCLWGLSLGRSYRKDLYDSEVALMEERDEDEETLAMMHTIERRKALRKAAQHEVLK